VTYSAPLPKPPWDKKNIGQPRSTRALYEYKNAFGQLLEERKERGGEGGEIYS